VVNAFADGKTKLVEPPYGSYVDSWQLPVNSNFGVTDASVSGTTTINVASIPISTPFVTLVFQNFDTSPTPWQVPLAGQNLRIVLTGTLAFNIILYIPANTPGMWIIDNQTSGAFSITVKTNAAGSAGVTPFQGAMSYVFCDGTNVNYADVGGAVYAINRYVPQSVPPGAIMPFAMESIPSGWLLCNGAGVSRTVYSSLFSAIGTVWGTGDGSTTFNVPNFLGAFLRGWNSGSSGNDGNRQFASYQADAVGPLTTTLNDPGHKHELINGYTGVGPYPVGGPQYPTPPSVSAMQSSTTGITVSVAGTSTASETRVKNYAIQYCIKT